MFRKPNPEFWKPLVIRELRLKPMRSRGPGGQHVNRTESAVLIQWDLESSSAFDSEQKQVLRSKVKSYLTLDGVVLMRVESERSLLLNKEIGTQKLLSLIEKSFEIPKKRIKTRPTRGSIERRIEGKSRRSETKKMRRKEFS